MAKPLLLVLCLALGVAPRCVCGVTPAGTSEPPNAQTAAPTEAETLQNEADNQENILSQVGAGPLPPVCPGEPGARTWSLLKGVCFSLIRILS